MVALAIKPALIVCLFVSGSLALWPQPVQFAHGDSVLWLSPTFEVTYQTSESRWGFMNWPQATWLKSQSLSFEDFAPNEQRNSPGDRAIILAAAERIRSRLFEEPFVPRKFHPRRTVFEPHSTTQSRHIKHIRVERVKRLELLPSCSTSSDETYMLKCDVDGQVTIKARSLVGCLHALETFSQLFYTHSRSVSDVYTRHVPFDIRDCPAFTHRGLNLDISRNWIRPQDVFRTLEAMARTKLNRLHLHAADAQSWPLEIPALPELALAGAYHGEQIWSVADLENVQSFGRDRGIQVYLELDMPGHTSSIAESHPELIVAAHEDCWSSYAVEPPSGQLKLNSTAVYDFLSTLLDDLMPRVTPFTTIMHFGGDEVNRHAFELDPTVRSSSFADLQPLLQALMDHVISIAAAHSVTPVVWQEMLLEWNLTLPESAIVQSWTLAESFPAIVARGHRALFGANTHWYLDCGHGQWLDPDPALGRETAVHPPYTDYCGPYKNWRMVYAYDPLVDVPDIHRHLVVGGEVHLWGELTDFVTVDSMLWPRAAAAAEVMWSGGGNMPDEDTTRRLAEMRERLVAAGVAAGMVQMEHCLKYRGSCKQ